jgi:transposase
MSQKELPIDLPQAKTILQVVATKPEQARLKRPVRNQVEMILRDLDSLISEDHPVRAIWDLIKGLDLSAFYGLIKAVADAPGRPASDPQVLLALWIYATVDGVGSARRLGRLCHEHDVYRWLCGGVPVDYHLLADFRVCHQEALDKLLTEIIASMMHNKLVTLKQVAQDGTRVRASAGAGSFHRVDSLERCLVEAEEQVKRLAEERDHPDPEVSLQERAARERAARERTERVQAALRELPVVQAAKEHQLRTRSKAERTKVTEARVSTTDAKARVMKMPDGGFRPACNVQFATDVGSGVIVGTSVVNDGTDAGQAEIMVTQIEQRSGVQPESYLIDGGFAQRDTITKLTKRQIEVYAPARSPHKAINGRKPGSPQSDDNPEMIAWRQRMETDQAKYIYKRRAATAEWTNAQVRFHGLTRFTVRGLDKVLSLVLLVTIAHNLLRWVALASQGASVT